MNPIILFDNILTEGTLTATSTASGYDVDNLKDYRVYTKWKAAGTTNQYLSWNMGGIAKVRAQTGWYIKLQNNALLGAITGSVDTADAIGIVNHNLGTIGAQIDVQYYESGAWNTVLTLNPTTDNAILSTFTSHTSGDWRIKLSGMSAAPEIGVMFLGVHLSFPWPPEAPVSPVREGIKSKTEISNTGNLLGTNLAFNPKTINHRFTNLTRTWFTTYYEPFWNNHAKLIYPFFYAWDLTNRPNDVFYGYIDDAIIQEEKLSLLNYNDELVLQMKGVTN